MTRPVFAGAEGFDLHLAVDDQAERDGLDAAGRARAGELAPEDRGELEADEVVEGAAGEVGVDQLHVDLARRFHRFGDGVPGDGVEDHALDGGVFLDRLAAGEGLEQVPGDRLALAVGVGGEDEFLVVLERLGDGAQVLGAVGCDLPFHREVVVGVDRAVLGGQIPDVAVGGEDRVAGAEVFVDGFRLGGRFDDDNGHESSLAAPGGPRRRPTCACPDLLSTAPPGGGESDREADEAAGVAQDAAGELEVEQRRGDRRRRQG